MGALTVAVVTKPFAFEGKRRMQQAERGISELMESVDTTIVIPNEKLLAVAENAGFFESFRVADDILRQGVQGISDIITIPGIINRDFADVRAIMAGMGYAVMGTATASGEHRTVEAAQRAISSPLLEAGAIDGARGILINITGSNSLKLAEVQQACTIIQSAAHEDANIIFGAVLDEKMKDSVKITVIATGFKEADMRRPRHHENYDPVIYRERFQITFRARGISSASPNRWLIPSRYLCPKPSFRARFRAGSLSGIGAGWCAACSGGDFARCDAVGRSQLPGGGSRHSGFPAETQRSDVGGTPDQRAAEEAEGRDSLRL